MEAKKDETVNFINEKIGKFLSNFRISIEDLQQQKIYILDLIIDHLQQLNRNVNFGICGIRGMDKEGACKIIIDVTI